ncbi:MAG: hypothetical protein HWD59_05265 [Coxiellaceae bacterium]|nr:MAG: hypothetical protein HWD59_05265 [Coxiellaceae bacterium]
MTIKQMVIGLFPLAIIFLSLGIKVFLSFYAEINTALRGLYCGVYEEELLRK